jgi:hypothetical protein
MLTTAYQCGSISVVHAREIPAMSTQRKLILIRQPHSAPPLGRIGRLLEALEKIQAACARGDCACIWWIAEKAIETNGPRGH